MGPSRPTAGALILVRLPAILLGHDHLAGHHARGHRRRLAAHLSDGRGRPLPGPR